MPGWDRFLSQRDRAHLAAGWGKPAPYGLGTRPALLVVDLEMGVRGDARLPLLEALSRWPLSCGEQAWDAIGRTTQLVAAARRSGHPVFYTATDPTAARHPAFASREPPDPADRARQFELVPELSPGPDEPVLRKVAASAFFGTSLAARLVRLGCDSVVVCGQTTSGCVRASVVDAAAFGFRTAVVEECTFDRTEASHWMSLFDMDHKYADVVSAEHATAYLHASR